MSLKAKVEAIIYATEEPVTLDQLASLLKDAVLAELRAEEDARLALNEIISDGLRRLRDRRTRKTTLHSTSIPVQSASTQNVRAEARRAVRPSARKTRKPKRRKNSRPSRRA